MTLNIDREQFFWENMQTGSMILTETQKASTR